MRSYLDIVIDLKDGKEVNKQELGLALLFAADQLNFANQDIKRLTRDRQDKQLIKKLIEENQDIRFNARKSSIDKWFGEDIPHIK